jgi:hypothetical protein
MGWSFYNSSGQLLTAPASTASADLATVATTVTVSDNESTDENNVITFVAGADADGGNVGLESDGNLHYNPSTGKVTATSFAGNLTGNVTGNTSGTAGSATGNAATATALASARTIGGVSFDGTGNINLPGVNTAGNQATSGLAATATLAATTTALASARTIGGVSFDGTGNITLPGVNSSGNQNTSGNAATVTTNANLTGHVTSSGNAAVLGSFTSAQLAGALSNETGSGLAVFGTSPTLATPILGTPQSGDLSNCTGAGVGLGLVIALS